MNNRTATPASANANGAGYGNGAGDMSAFYAEVRAFWRLVMPIGYELISCLFGAWMPHTHRSPQYKKRFATSMAKSARSPTSIHVP